MVSSSPTSKQVDAWHLHVFGLLYAKKGNGDLQKVYDFLYGFEDGVRRIDHYVQGKLNAIQVFNNYVQGQITGIVRFSDYNDLEESEQIDLIQQRARFFIGPIEGFERNIESIKGSFIYYSLSRHTDLVLRTIRQMHRNTVGSISK